MRSPAPVQVDTRYGLTLDRSDYVEYLSAQGSPLLVSFAQGYGVVWLSSAPKLFTNDGLRNDANAGLVDTLVKRTPAGSLVAFDEYHLGFHGEAAQDHSLLLLIYTTPWGWAVLYGLIVVFACLLVNGQRLGRTIPLPHSIARRNPVEFVTAMAQLFRLGWQARAWCSDIITGISSGIWVSRIGSTRTCRTTNSSRRSCGATTESTPPSSRISCGSWETRGAGKAGWSGSATKPSTWHNEEERDERQTGTRSVARRGRQSAGGSGRGLCSDAGAR